MTFNLTNPFFPEQHLEFTNSQLADASFYTSLFFVAQVLGVLAFSVVFQETIVVSSSYIYKRRGARRSTPSIRTPRPTPLRLTTGVRSALEQPLEQPLGMMRAVVGEGARDENDRRQQPREDAVGEDAGQGEEEDEVDGDDDDTADDTDDTAAAAGQPENNIVSLLGHSFMVTMRQTIRSSRSSAEHPGVGSGRRRGNRRGSAVV